MEVKFTYGDESVINDGDICFYSEDSGNHMNHFADSVVQMEQRNGKMGFTTLFYTTDQGKSFVKLNNSPWIDIIGACFQKGSDPERRAHQFNKIGHMDTDSEKLNLEWINKNLTRDLYKEVLNSN